MQSLASSRPSCSAPRASARRLARRCAAPRSVRARASSSCAGECRSTSVASRRRSMDVRAALEQSGSRAAQCRHRSQLPIAAPARDPRQPCGERRRCRPVRRARRTHAIATARRAGSRLPRARRAGQTRPRSSNAACTSPWRSATGRVPRADRCWRALAGFPRQAAARSSCSAASIWPRSTSAQMSTANANRIAEPDVVGVQEIERRPCVGFGIRHGASPQHQPAAMREQERHSRDRSAFARVRERLLEATIGEIERVGSEQADHERVERTDDVGILLAEQAAAGSARSMCIAASLADSLARACSNARLARTRSLAGRGAAELACRAAGVAADARASRLRLLRLGRELRLEQQRELAVVRFDDSDRRLDGLHGAIAVAGQAQRVRELTNRDCGAAPVRRIDSIAAARCSTASGIASRSSAVPSSSSTSGQSHRRRRFGERTPAAKRRPRRARLARAPPRPPAQQLDAAGSPIGSDSAICAATRSRRRHCRRESRRRERARACARASRCRRTRPRARSGARTRRLPPVSRLRA